MDLKKKLKNRETVFGAWNSWYHPSLTESFCSIMKPDFLGIDIEHSTFSQEQCQRIIAAGQSSGVAVLPRVASHNPEQIRRMLDSGADGVMVPMVNHPEEVAKIVEWMKYPPLGKRGYGVSRAQGYGHTFMEYTRAWNDRSVLVIQVETVTAVENIDKLLANDHVDGVMIGPYDISGSLGIPGQLADPKVLKACSRVVEACQRFGKSCGTQIVEPSEENVKEAMEQGYTFAVLASDLFLVWKWSERMHQLIRHVREAS